MILVAGSDRRIRSDPAHAVKGGCAVGPDGFAAREAVPDAIG
jgi:hypothetical protein